MLYPIDDRMLTLFEEQVTEQYLREAKVARLLDETQRPAPNRRNRQARQVLHGVGHWLMRMGQRLERLEYYEV